MPVKKSHVIDLFNERQKEVLKMLIARIDNDLAKEYKDGPVKVSVGDQVVGEKVRAEITKLYSAKDVGWEVEFYDDMIIFR